MPQVLQIFLYIFPFCILFCFFSIASTTYSAVSNSDNDRNPSFPIHYQLNLQSINRPFGCLGGGVTVSIGAGTYDTVIADGETGVTAAIPGYTAQQPIIVKAPPCTAFDKKIFVNPEDTCPG